MNIDTDEPCKQCGKGGAVNHGICLECATKNITKKRENEMISGIGEKTIEAMIKQSADLIQTHKRKIQEAFFQAHEGKLKVGIGINIVQVDSRLAVESTITYTVEKVSDKQSAFIEENQAPLFAA